MYKNLQSNSYFFLINSKEFLLQIPIESPSDFKSIHPFCSKKDHTKLCH